MVFETIFNQIFILAILALIGIIGVKTSILGENSKTVIEKLVFYITLPLLIITKLSSLDFTFEILLNGVYVILGTYSILAIQIAIGRVSARLFGLSKPQAVIHSLHTFLGNIVFLGFPLLDALFPGGEAILYAALYQLVMNTVLWSYGIVQLAPQTKDSGLKNFKKLVNPNTIALIIGLSMMLLKIKLPFVLYEPLKGLGNTTLYLAMLYIGILLSQTTLRSTFRNKDVLFLSLNKLLLIPGLLMLIFYLLFNFTAFDLDKTALSVLILEASMPCMTILVLLAKRYGADDKKAMENFVVSTIFSLFTLPVILYFLEQIK